MSARTEVSNMNRGVIAAVCTSDRKHVQKSEVEEAVLVSKLGIEGDAHAGFAHRQVSLLADESIDKMRAKGLDDLFPGAFGENLVTQGIDLLSLSIGDRLKVGEGITLEVTQIGKECIDRCAIYIKVGDCVMPREGIFTKVVTGGKIKPGDEITVVEE